MANKNDFTPEEWTKVLESIIAAGIAVSAVDPSGLWGTLKEAAAGTPALAAAKRDPNSNELIKAAVADFERSADGSILAMRERFAQAEPTECVQRSLASLREVSAIVDAKAPEEAAAFKTWLRQISQKVAEAAVEGSFLGFGGVRVSDAETATLRDISKALGMILAHRSLLMALSGIAARLASGWKQKGSDGSQTPFRPLRPASRHRRDRRARDLSRCPLCARSGPSVVRLRFVLRTVSGDITERRA